MKVFFLVCLACMTLFFTNLSAQSSKIVNFSRDQFKAGLQNWAFEQDEQGILYVANNEGLLTFNGAKWQLSPLPNNTIVRSISFGHQGRLYAGGQDEIGYFQPNHSGKLMFTSLIDLVPEQYRQFADIWQIVTHEKAVFFQSSTYIFRLQNDTITGYPASTQWNFLGKMHNGEIVAKDKIKGLFTFKSNKWEPTNFSNPLPADAVITSMCSINSKSLITTSNNGLFLLSGNYLAPFAISGNSAFNNEHFTSAKALNNGDILLGTYEHGAIRTDSSGFFLENISVKQGLKNNNVKCIYTDKAQQVWLGLDDGISFIDFNTAINWVNPGIFNGAQGYSVALGGNKIYFAMANGLYQMPYTKQQNWSKANNSITKIANGLTWRVSNLNESILVGRDDGFYQWRGNNLDLIDRSIGYWVFTSIKNETDSTKIAAGNYNGVTLFNKTKQSFSKDKIIGTLNNSARFLEFDSLTQAIWISHPYRGVFKIGIQDDAVVHYTKAKGLPSTLNNHIFKINNQILAATLQGIYVHNAQKDLFEPSPLYQKIFNALSLRYLKSDSSGNLWFISEKKLGVVQASTQSIVYFPELERKLASGFEHIYPIDQEHVLVGGEQGFFLLNYAKYLSSNGDPIVYLSKIKANLKSDTLLFGGFGNIKGLNTTEKTQLHHPCNEIYFEYASPFSARSENLMYSYRLQGLQNNWSAWTYQTEKGYNNLSAGTYTFEVKVRNNLNKESSVVSYSFVILPPWYGSFWAKLIYVLLTCSLLYFIYTLQSKNLKRRHDLKLLEERKKHEATQKIMAYEHQLAIEKSEKEIVQLKNEKLETELAASALNLVQKKEFLHKIKEEIDRAYKNDADHINPADVRKMLRELTTEDKLDEDWDQFSVHFNSVHNNFLISLKNKFPHLSAHDLKLCAYLRLNISSKEMARLMSISIRGVEINRYRLRKKLNLQPKENLFEFLLSIEGSKE